MTPATVDSDWIENRLPEEGPRLIWQPGDEALTATRIAEDPTAKIYHDFLISQANGLLDIAPLERIQIGRRLLSVSRAALKRTTLLAYAWRTTGNPKYLDRLNTELLAVCSFSDWNPSHFLDVAEMALAVSLGIDWAAEGLPSETIRIAKSTLIAKAIDHALTPQWWQTARMNWNQVCNGGLTAAALVTFEEAPEKATITVNNMLAGLPNVLETYAPDGVYVEGATYWGYGTGYNVILFSLLESALGTDFEMHEYPGFMESADFVNLVEAPSGEFYNFFDCGDRIEFNEPMLWFAQKTGNAQYAQLDNIRRLASRNIDPAGDSQRHAVIGFLWYIHSNLKSSRKPPLTWHGRSENPLVVFRSSADDPNALYLAAKGGKATLNHGNMDAGSFIMELNGVRWAIDPGNQGYNELEEVFKRIGGSLWANEQDSKRWTLLTKNNFGHNTLTVDSQLHVNDGHADIISFDASRKSASIDLTAPLGDKVEKAIRTVSVINDQSVRIKDEIQLAPGAEKVTWQMLTQAEVLTQPEGALLRQAGKELSLNITSPLDAHISIISLDPPPLGYDKRMEGLKRIEIAVPAYLASEGLLEIEVFLEFPE